MKKLIIAGLFILISAAQSCLHVYQPLITEKELIAEKNVLGTWSNGKTTIHIEEYGNSLLKKEINRNTSQPAEEPSAADIRDSIVQNHLTYILSYSDMGSIYYYVMQLTKINNELYTQVMPIVNFPVKDGKVITDKENYPGARFNSLTGMEITGSWAFGKIEKHAGDQISIRFFDGVKLRQLILDGKMKIPFEFDGLFDNFLVTAESSDLRSVVTKYGLNENLYSKEFSFELKRIR